MRLDTGSAFFSITSLPDIFSQYGEKPSDFHDFFNNPARFENIRVLDYLPHETALNFLRKVKKEFGLVFFYDKASNTIYLENYNEFYGLNVIDLTDKLDYSSDPKFEIPAYKYKIKQHYKYKSDSSDPNLADPEYDYTHTIDNNFCKVGIEPNESDEFSESAIDDEGIPLYGSQFLSMPQGQKSYRNRNFVPRLLRSRSAISRPFYSTHGWRYFDATLTNYNQNRAIPWEKSYLF